MTKILAITTFLALIGCQTLSDKQDETPKKITDETPINEATEEAIKFGAQTLVDAKKTFAKRKAWPIVNKLLLDRIPDGIINYSNIELVNAVNLYQASTVHLSLPLFQKMVQSGRPLARDLGWNMAASMPSRTVAAAIDSELTRLVESNEEKSVLSPELARAVHVNGIRSSYTLMREGLYNSGHDAFAKAMITLEPERAAKDFMTYLSMASPEELRQMNLKTVDLYTCVAILTHLTKHQISISHENFDHLFLYAISRNKALGELGVMVINSYLPKHKEHLALLLSRHPDWIQIAYIEAVKRKMNPTVGGLLAELKTMTAHKHVRNEIETVL